MSRLVAVGAMLLLGSGAAAEQAPAELLFQAEAQTLTGTCTGEPVRLEGNHNTVILTGACGSLLLKGVANTVVMGIRPAGTIHVEGSANRVRFAVQGAAPTIEALGPDNEVVPGPGAVPVATPPPATPPPATPPPAKPGPAIVPAAKPQPSPTAGPLALDGDDKARLAECAGLDVTVTGLRSAYVLHGGCKSLTVRGDLLAVQAEVAPGARIAITGRGSIVTWTVHGKGRPPASIVRGEGSRAQRAEPEPK